jgi:Tfp pilus assembly protein PilO
MRRPSRGILVIGLTVLSFAALCLYLHGRSGEMHHMQDQIVKLQRDRLSLQSKRLDPQIFERMIPINPDVSVFIESLYECAKATGIKNHEVATVASTNGREEKSGQERMGSRGREEEIRRYVVKISFEGSYRETAEYVRLLQNIERFKRITELQVKPEKNLLKATITLEILSRERPDAA